MKLIFLPDVFYYVFHRRFVAFHEFDNLFALMGVFEHICHKDISYDNGATKKGLFGILDKVIKTSSRIAITISEKI